MTKIKLTDNLSLSQIIRGFWRLDTWELSTDELIDNMKSSIDLGVTSFEDVYKRQSHIRNKIRNSSSKT